jgi:hypothetical protein
MVQALESCVLALQLDSKCIQHLKMCCRSWFTREREQKSLRSSSSSYARAGSRLAGSRQQAAAMLEQQAAAASKTIRVSYVCRLACAMPSLGSDVTDGHTECMYSMMITITANALCHHEYMYYVTPMLYVCSMYYC